MGQERQIGSINTVHRKKKLEKMKYPSSMNDLINKYAEES